MNHSVTPVTTPARTLVTAKGCLIAESPIAERPAAGPGFPPARPVPPARDSEPMSTHQLDQAVFGSILPEDIDWEPFSSFPPPARRAVVVGVPAQPAPYVVRVVRTAGMQSEIDARALLESALAGPLDVWVKDQIVAEASGNPLALLELPRAMTPADIVARAGVRSSPPGA